MMRTNTNLFIANLILADIIITMFAITFIFQAALLQQWNLPLLLCALFPFIQGLLIEEDPKYFALLKKKNRNAWAARACLSIKEHPHKANFFQHFNKGKVLNTEEVENYIKEKYVQVQCMPLFSFLAAINVTTIDYFSLDVEGSELKVLKTIPFDKVFIKTLSVEYTSIPERKEGLINFMISKNYSVAGEFHKDPIKGYAKDVMLMHEDIAKNYIVETN